MDFMIGFDEDGNIKFASKSMERNWNRLKGFFQQSGSYFRITVETSPDKNSTEAQHRLLKRICKMVEEDTGQDFGTVYKEFLKLTPMKTMTTLFGEMSERNKTIEELTTKEFSTFLEQVLVHANDIMGCEYILQHDDNVGTLLTRKQ